MFHDHMSGSNHAAYSIYFASHLKSEAIAMQAEPAMECSWTGVSRPQDCQIESPANFESFWKVLESGEASPWMNMPVRRIEAILYLEVQLANVEGELLEGQDGP